MAFFIVFEDIIYPALTNKIAIVGCFFDDYNTELLATSNKKPPTVLLLFRFWAQLEFIYLTESKVSFS